MFSTFQLLDSIFISLPSSTLLFVPELFSLFWTAKDTEATTHTTFASVSIDCLTMRLTSLPILCTTAN